eukprot:UC1_evm2s788
MGVDRATELRRFYYAAVTHTDEMIGSVLSALEAKEGLLNNTVVAFMGDHGWHLADNNLWGKCTVYEVGTRVPLMLAVPGQTDAGVVSTPVAEAVDLAPSLVQAAGLPKLPLCAVPNPNPNPSPNADSGRGMQGSGDCTEGVSLLPRIKAPTRPQKTAVFSQYPVPGCGGPSCGKARVSTAKTTKKNGVKAVAQDGNGEGEGESEGEVKNEGEGEGENDRDRDSDRARKQDQENPYEFPSHMGYTIRTQGGERFTEWVEMEYQTQNLSKSSVTGGIDTTIGISDDTEVNCTLCNKHTHKHTHRRNVSTTTTTTTTTTTSFIPKWGPPVSGANPPRAPVGGNYCAADPLNRFEYYNHNVDPQERHNLALGNPSPAVLERMRALQKMLHNGWRAALVDRGDKG